MTERETRSRPPVPLRELTPPAQGTAVCLGTFDGVHRGHQALAAETVRRAREMGLLPCAYTFDRPPAGVLGAGSGALLTDMDEKARLLTALGLEVVAYSRFDAQVAACPPETFFEELLLKRLRARYIVIGFHYRFGYRARGDAEMMARLCRAHGVGLSVVPPVRMPDGELVSSTAVRAYLRAGNRARAEEMLNRALSEREAALLGG